MKPEQLDVFRDQKHQSQINSGCSTLLSLPPLGLAVVPKLGSACAAEDLEMFKSACATLLEIGVKKKKKTQQKQTKPKPGAVMVVQVPLTLVTQMSDGKMLEMGGKKRESRVGPMAGARSGVVPGFPEVWLDAEEEIRIPAGGTQLIPAAACPASPEAPSRSAPARGGG